MKKQRCKLWVFTPSPLSPPRWQCFADYGSYGDNPETLLHYGHGLIAPRHSEKAGALCQGRWH